MSTREGVGGPLCSRIAHVREGLGGQVASRARAARTQELWEVAAEDRVLAGRAQSEAACPPAP